MITNVFQLLCIRYSAFFLTNIKPTLTDWLAFEKSKILVVILIQTNVSNFLSTLAFSDQMSSRYLFIKSTKLLRIPLLAKGTRFIMPYATKGR